MQNDINKNNYPSFKEFKDWVIMEIVPRLNAPEGAEETIGDALDSIAKKYAGQLVSFDIVKKELLTRNYVETCDRVIYNDRSNPDFDGDDTESEQVDFGAEFITFIEMGDFQSSYQDYFEEYSTLVLNF